MSHQLENELSSLISGFIHANGNRSAYAMRVEISKLVEVTKLLVMADGYMNGPSLYQLQYKIEELKCELGLIEKDTLKALKKIREKFFATHNAEDFKELHWSGGLPYITYCNTKGACHANAYLNTSDNLIVEYLEAVDDLSL